MSYVLHLMQTAKEIPTDLLRNLTADETPLVIIPAKVKEAQETGTTPGYDLLRYIGLIPLWVFTNFYYGEMVNFYVCVLRENMIVQRDGDRCILYNKSTGLKMLQWQLKVQEYKGDEQAAWIDADVSDIPVAERPESRLPLQCTLEDEGTDLFGDGTYVLENLLRANCTVLIKRSTAVYPKKNIVLHIGSGLCFVRHKVQN